MCRFLLGHHMFIHGFAPLIHFYYQDCLFVVTPPLAWKSKAGACNQVPFDYKFQPASCSEFYRMPFKAGQNFRSTCHDLEPIQWAHLCF